jgi:hypothetical protein
MSLIIIFSSNFCDIIFCISYFRRKITQISVIIEEHKRLRFLFIFLFLFFYYFIIHMCIQGLGHFSPLPPPPPLPPTLSLLFPSPPQYPAETILPLFLILL